MKVGHYKLCTGYILQSGDELLIHGCDYIVSGAEGHYHLSCSGRPNTVVFERLGIREAEKYKWAKQFGSTGRGVFPEFERFEDLTRFVKAIYETSPYKVGDCVRIVSRVGNCGEYPFSYVDEMADMAGRVFKITEIETLSDWDSEVDAEKFHGDPHKYYLDAPGSWSWHSSMFTKITDADISYQKPKETDYGSGSSSLDAPSIDKNGVNDVDQIIIKPKQIIKTIIIL